MGMGVVGAGGAMAESKLGQGVGARSARWQVREGMVGAGGHMAIAGGGGAGGHNGNRLMAGSQMRQGQGGLHGQKGEDGRVHDCQLAVAGGSGGGMEQEFKMVGRQGPDQAVRAS